MDIKVFFIEANNNSSLILCLSRFFTGIAPCFNCLLSPHLVVMEIQANPVIQLNVNLNLN